jgi:hypothetical protein
MRLLKAMRNQNFAPIEVENYLRKRPSVRSSAQYAHVIIVSDTGE